MKQHWSCGLFFFANRYWHYNEEQTIRDTSSEANVCLWCFKVKIKDQKSLYSQTIIHAFISLGCLITYSIFSRVTFFPGGSYFCCCTGPVFPINKVSSRLKSACLFVFVFEPASALLPVSGGRTLKTSRMKRSSRMIWKLMTNSWEKRWASIVSMELTPGRQAKTQKRRFILLYTLISKVSLTQVHSVSSESNWLRWIIH